jgi:hypothetical protein
MEDFWVKLFAFVGWVACIWGGALVLKKAIIYLLDGVDKLLNKLHPFPTYNKSDDKKDKITEPINIANDIHHVAQMSKLVKHKKTISSTHSVTDFQHTSHSKTNYDTTDMVSQPVQNKMKHPKRIIRRVKKGVNRNRAEPSWLFLSCLLL